MANPTGLHLRPLSEDATLDQAVSALNELIKRDIGLTTHGSPVSWDWDGNQYTFDANGDVMSTSVSSTGYHLDARNRLGYHRRTRKGSDNNALETLVDGQWTLDGNASINQILQTPSAIDLLVQPATAVTKLNKASAANEIQVYENAASPSKNLSVKHSAITWSADGLTMSGAGGLTVTASAGNIAQTASAGTAALTGHTGVTITADTNALTLAATAANLAATAGTTITLSSGTSFSLTGGTSVSMTATSTTFSLTAGTAMTITGGTTLTLNSTGTITIAAAGSNAIVLSTNGALAFQVGATGIVSLGASGSSADGTASAPILTFNNDPNTGLFRIAADTLGVTCAGAEALRVESTGNVALGVNSSGGFLLRVSKSSAGVYLMNVYNSNTGGSGLAVDAGSSSSETVLLLRNSAQSTTHLQVYGDGGVVVGSPTGGDKGAGSINAVTVWRNGTSLDHVLGDQYNLLPIADMKSHYMRMGCLPTLPTEAVHRDGSTDVGALGDRLWETAEVHARYIAEIDERLRALEAG